MNSRYIESFWGLNRVKIQNVFNLVAVSTDSHQEVVGFDITMNEILVMNVLNAANHLNTVNHISWKYSAKSSFTPYNIRQCQLN